ncbi:PAS domain-containing protein [Temperatibacter marinus]|uniref:PAS domain-containing protein n=1 Tax=Temperatibacter marinus TaxID=1456591 RepID=A0AA52HAN0_9PROT|nr:PAS domain-containing protein [Temperatibacter marinus]WND03772.1 PAS domain-containing protein [Temperatibacter marinus]
MGDVATIVRSWHDKINEKDLPCRSTFSPMKMGRFLGYTYILEQNDEGIFFRLAGSDLETIWGQSLASENITALLSSIESYNIYHGLIKYAFDQKIGLIFTGLLKDKHSNFRSIEEVVLPYDKKGRTEMIGVQFVGNGKSGLTSFSENAYIITNIKMIVPSGMQETRALPLELEDLIKSRSIPIEIAEKEM